MYVYTELQRDEVIARTSYVGTQNDSSKESETK